MRDSKIDYFNEGPVRFINDENVGWFEITMNCAFLMGMVDGETNVDEKVEPRWNIQTFFITIFCNGQSSRQFHNKERLSSHCGSRLNQTGNIGVIHHCQNFLFNLKALEDGAGIHSEF